MPLARVVLSLLLSKVFMAASASIPRVAVVGGGLSGTLSSLVLANRGLSPVLIDGGRAVGGRLRGSARSVLKNKVDAGAQFIRPSDFRFAQVCKMLQGNGLLAPWQGRFGMLGSQGGGFLPSSIVGQVTAAGIKKQQDDDYETTDDATRYTDTGDFCGFVANHHNADYPTYVALPDNESLCREICRMANIELLEQTTVQSANTLAQGGWQLNVEQNGVAQEQQLEFDALILATHDPALAARTVDKIVSQEAMASPSFDTKDSKLLIHKLQSLSKDLERIRESRQPVFTWSGNVSLDNDVEFDAVGLPGSSLLQFLARESSKPGRQDSEGIWTAVSTSLLARDILSRHGSTKAASDEACQILTTEVCKLLGTKDTQIQDASAVRWGAAFSGSSLKLKEDSIFLHPWRLGIAGDFISENYPTPLEAGAMSGLEVAERMTQMFETLS